MLCERNVKCVETYFIVNTSSQKKGLLPRKPEFYFNPNLFLVFGNTSSNMNEGVRHWLDLFWVKCHKAFTQKTGVCVCVRPTLDSLSL